LPASYVVKVADSRRILRWALLLHDIAKPETLRYLPTGVPCFHGHEVLGAQRAQNLLERLRLPRSERKRIVRIVLNHLRPGHLADAGTPARGVRRLVRDAGADLPLLVLHAGCDVRASGGPPDRERRRRLRATLQRLVQIADERARRPLPRLLGGDLLIESLGLEPGPRIGRILRKIRDAQEAGDVRTRDEALQLARRLVREGV
jgi:tRNA nucleotidyltransferase/poly(A) polymerase